MEACKYRFLGLILEKGCWYDICILTGSHPQVMLTQVAL